MLSHLGRLCTCVRSSFYYSRFIIIIFTKLESHVAGVSAAGSIQSSKAGGSSSAAPAPPAGSTAEAEMQAVRNRALASANLATVKRHTVADPAARSSPAAPSPHAAGVKPVLRLRASAPHQVTSFSAYLLVYVPAPSMLLSPFMYKSALPNHWVTELCGHSKVLVYYTLLSVAICKTQLAAGSKA